MHVEPKPPPINIKTVESIQPLRYLLDEITEDETVYTIKANTARVRPKEGHIYFNISKALGEERHKLEPKDTYKPKTERTPVCI